MAGIHAPAQRQQPAELLQIRLHRRLHVRVLQLAGQFRTVERTGAVHLPERSRRRRRVLEAGESFLPVGAKLGRHPPLDEGPAHGRRFALQLHQLAGIGRRQRVGNGGEQLRHLHDRPFQAAERGCEIERVAIVILRAAEHACGRHAGRHAADIAADFGVALGAGGEAVFFAVGHSLALHGTRAVRVDC